MPGILFNTCEVGTKAKVKIGEHDYNLTLLHKGNPDPEIYDPSCSGLWVRLDSSIGKSARPYSNRTIEESGVFLALADFYETLPEGFKSLIQKVKIPYVYKMKNSSSDGTYYYPAEPHILSDGYETHLFTLSILEVGYNPQSSTVSGNDYREWTDMVPDGAKLDYFDEAKSDAAKRVIFSDYTETRKVYFWTRSQLTKEWHYYVHTDGGCGTQNAGTTDYPVMMAAVLSSERTYLDEDGYIVANTPPIITGTDGDLGTFEETSPTYAYTVTDQQGGTVSVTEALDGTTLRTYDVTLGQENTLTIPADVYRRTLNGAHTLTVTAEDVTGGISVRTETFTKNVTSCAFTQTESFPADDRPTRCTAQIHGEFPVGCALKVEACNNGNDASPAWEDVTQPALLGQRYFFKNEEKTAASWGVRFRASLERGTAETACHISSIGGVFQ